MTWTTIPWLGTKADLKKLKPGDLESRVVHPPEANQDDRALTKDEQAQLGKVLASAKSDAADAGTDRVLVTLSGHVATEEDAQHRPTSWSVNVTEVPDAAPEDAEAAHAALTSGGAVLPDPEPGAPDGEPEPGA